MGLSDKKVSGEKLRISAADWNAITESARRSRDQARFGSETPPLVQHTSVCLVKNETGADQPRFAVLGLDEPIILPATSAAEFKRQLTFRGALPVAGTHEGKYAILLQPLPDGAIGDAVLSGVVPCKLTVDVLDDVLGWAEIADGETAMLQNVAVGSARVLWAESSGTERWALVRLAEGTTTTAAAQVEMVRVTGDAPLFGRYPAKVQDYDADAEVWSDRDESEEPDSYLIDPADTALTEGIYLARRWGEYSGLPVFTPSRQVSGTAPVVTQVSWTADQTDYALPADTTVLMIQSLDADRTLHGMAGGTNGRTVWIHNASSFSLFLDAGTGTAGNYFAITLGQTVRIQPGDGMAFTWTATQNSWQCMGKVGFTVEDELGADTTYALDWIVANRATGLNFWESAPNEVTFALLAATPTQSGTVNLDAQAWAGPKTFINGLNSVGFATFRNRTVTWATDQTDFAVGGNARLLSVNATANVLLNSLLFSGTGTTPDASGEAQIRYLIILNTNATNTLTLVHQAGVGTAAGRLFCDGEADIVLRYREAAYGFYDPNLERHCFFRLGYHLQMSLTEDAGGIKLVGDEASPGNRQFYKTDGAGAKGWAALVAADIPPLAGTAGSLVALAVYTTGDTTVQRAFNVDSVTRSGAGDYEVVWLAPFDDAYYSAHISFVDATVVRSRIVAQDAAGITVEFYDGSAALTDPAQWSVTVFTEGVYTPPDSPEAMVIAEGAGTSDTQAEIEIVSYDAAAATHDLYRHTAAMGGDPEGVGTLLDDNINPAVDYTDGTVSAATTYYYQVVSRSPTFGVPATLSNEVAITTGAPPFGVLFDGTDDVLDGADTALQPARITLIARFIPTATDATNGRTLLSMPGGPRFAWAVAPVNGGGSAFPAAGIQVSGVNYVVVGDEALPLGEEAHLAMTYDGTDLKFYVNGVLKDTVSISGVIDYGDNATGRFVVGEFYDSATNQFTGSLLYWKVYDEALDGTAIEDDYEGSHSATNLVAFWDWEDLDAGHDDGDPVTTWTDSVAAIDVTQGDSGKQPTYQEP